MQTVSCIIGNTVQYCTKKVLNSLKQNICEILYSREYHSFSVVLYSIVQYSTVQYSVVCCGIEAWKNKIQNSCVTQMG